MLLTARVEMAWEYLYHICIILLQIFLYNNMYNITIIISYYDIIIVIL